MTRRPTPDEPVTADNDSSAVAEDTRSPRPTHATGTGSGPTPPTDGGEGREAEGRGDRMAAAEPAGEGTPPAGGGGDAGDDDVAETGGDVALHGEEVELTDDLQAAADALEVDLELLLSERAQYLDAYRRAQADFENYRKQAQRRQDDAVVRALGGFVDKLLPVLDACDAALSHGATEVEPVLAALYGALAKEGLERIDPKGEPFDPAEAEAVLHEPGEGGEQVVSEVLRTGYRWRGRVLRPALVKVTD